MALTFGDVLTPWYVRAKVLIIIIFTSVTLLPITSSSATEIIHDIDPVKTAFGKKQQINLSLPQWQADATLSMQPSGPIVTEQLLLQQTPIDILQANNLSYVLVRNNVDKNDIIAIDWKNGAKIIARYKVANRISQMKYDGTHLVIAINNWGIEWLDISVPTKIQSAGIYRTKGIVKTLSVSKVQLAYSKQARSIQIFKVTKSDKRNVSASPLKIIHVSHPINDLALSGDLLIVADEQTGLSVFDISKPKQTTMLSGFKTTGTALNIHLDGNIIYLADGPGGLAIFDISKPKNIVWRGSHSKLGAVNQVWVNTQLAIINNDNRRMASLNIDRLELPITGSLFKPAHRIIAATLVDSTVFVASANKIEKIDFSHPASTQISHSGVNQGGSRRAFIENGIAYVADWFSGLHIYDIRIPHQPRHLGNYHTPGSSKGVIVKDSIAYIGDDDHGLQIVDVSDPTNPVKISEVLTTGLAYTLKLINHKVYLADHRGGLHIIDVSNIREPKIIGSFNTPGKSWALDVKDNFVFVADDLSGLLAFDVSNPKLPTLVGQFSPGGYAEDVVVKDNIAYVTFFDHGLYVLDISKPQAIKEISHIDIPGNARSVAIQDGYAYISGWESGLQIVDVSRPKFLSRLGYLDTEGSTWGADVSGDYAYLWDWWGGIKIVDIRNPRKPTLVGRYQGRSQIQQIQKIGNYAYTANGSSGMQVFDITNPLNPIWVTGLDLSGFAAAITTSEGTAYLAMGDAGIVKVDISDPFSPRWLSHINTSSYSRHIQQYNDFIYVSHASGNVDIIDVKSTQVLTHIGQIPIQANDLLVVNNLLLLADASGLSSFSLQDAANPTLKQHLALPKPTEKLSVENNIVAAIFAGNRVAIFQIIKQVLQPIHRIQHNEYISNILIDQGKLYIYDNINGLIIHDIAPWLTTTATTATRKNSKSDNLVLINTGSSTTMNVRYPATGVYTAMLAHKNTLLFSGQSSIASLALIPNIEWRHTGKQQLQLQIPKNLPLGDYDIQVELASGQKFLYPSVIQVILGKSKKPQMSMQQFKKLLKQHTRK